MHASSGSTVVLTVGWLSEFGGGWDTCIYNQEEEETLLVRLGLVTRKLVTGGVVLFSFVLFFRVSGAVYTSVQINDL